MRQATIDSFMRHKEDGTNIGALHEGLATLRHDILRLDPSQRSPRSAEDRKAIESGKVRILGYNVNLTSTHISELLKLSDELNLNEKECADLWGLVS
ncbi:unnamed protein product, partial [Choristocarpus tenellus]